MATPITFSPFLGWVDATDPNNIPAEVRIIGASDLMRYETFAKDAAVKINSTESTVESHTTTLSDHGGTLTEHEQEIGALQSWRTTTDLDIANLKKHRALATKTANHTTAAADSVIIGNGASITITLMSAATATAGRIVTVKNRHTTNLTVGSAAGTIDGAATKVLAQWASATFVSDGANWYVV